jgi:predicted  nucleic acid-binding Zn-ribbon protein
LILNSDLQHLIELQDLDMTAERLRRRIADLPSLQAALEARVGERTAAVAIVKEGIAANRAARQEIEKDLGAVQTRLSKYKDQLMSVKTNKEYQAMQTEISAAEQSVRAQEDRLLERMEETDTLTAELKAADAALKTEQTEVARQKQELSEEAARDEQELQGITSRRGQIAAVLSSAALSLFEHVAKHRKGLALSEARNGHCTQCHVRLRPQVFNDVRRNEGLIQCESCSRILYFVPSPATSTAPQAS